MKINIYNTLVSDLKNRVLNTFGYKENDLLILYGSAATGKVTSDFDCCIVRQDYSSQDLVKAVDLIVSFHKDHNLPLDDEVPHENKIMYSPLEIIKTISQTPFSQNSIRKVIIDKVIKDKHFLSSPQIKSRLMFNLLTTNSVLLLGSEKQFKQYKTQAWNALSLLMFSYGNNKPVTPLEFVKNLCTDSATHASGEDFLGYKQKSRPVMDYLCAQTTAYFAEKTRYGHMIYKNGRYCFNTSVLKAFIQGMPCTTPYTFKTDYLQVLNFSLVKKNSLQNARNEI